MKIQKYCSKASQVKLEFSLDKNILRVNDEVMVSVLLDTSKCDLELERIQVCI